MFAKYAWLSGASVASVLDDIAKLACGTPIASLSSACDKPNSVLIANATPSNWQQVDTAYTGARVLRSLNLDGTTYKYAYFYLNGSNKLAFRACEDWNSSTHASVNEAFYKGTTIVEPLGNTTIAQTSNTTTSAGSLYVYATSRSFFIDGVQVAEFTRSSKALGVSYPCHMIWNPALSSAYRNMYVGQNTSLGTGGGVGVCRWRNTAGSDWKLNSLPGAPSTTTVLTDITDLLATASYQVRTPGDISFIHTTPALVRVFGYTGASQPCLINLGKVFDLQVSGSGGIAIAPYDEIQLNGVTHFCIGTYNSYVFYLPKA